jgi:hypothetical protein
MPAPTPVSGRIRGSLVIESEKLRMRIVNLWGNAVADSEVSREGEFHFAAVSYGNYVLMLIHDGKPVWSTHVLKYHNALEGLSFDIPPPQAPKIPQ